MVSLGILLQDIWAKDATFIILQRAFSTKVCIFNETITIEEEGLGLAIVTLWNLLYDTNGSTGNIEELREKSIGI